LFCKKLINKIYNYVGFICFFYCFLILEVGFMISNTNSNLNNITPVNPVDNPAIIPKKTDFSKDAIQTPAQAILQDQDIVAETPVGKKLPDDVQQVLYPDLTGTEQKTAKGAEQAKIVPNIPQPSTTNSSGDSVSQSPTKNASQTSSLGQLDQHSDPYKLLEYAPFANKDNKNFLWFLHQAFIREGWNSRPPEVQKALKHMIMNAWRKGAAKSGDDQQTPIGENFEYYRGNLSGFILKRLARESISQQFPQAFKEPKDVELVNSPKLALAEIRRQTDAQVVRIDQVKDFEDQIELMLKKVLQNENLPLTYFDFSPLLSEVIKDRHFDQISSRTEELRNLFYQKIEVFLRNNPNLSCHQIDAFIGSIRNIQLIAFQKRSEGFVAIIYPTITKELTGKSGDKSIIGLLENRNFIKRKDEFNKYLSFANLIERGDLSSVKPRKKNMFSLGQLLEFERLVARLPTYTAQLTNDPVVLKQMEEVEVFKKQLDQVKEKWKEPGADPKQLKEELKQLNQAIDNKLRDMRYDDSGGNYLKMIQMDLKGLQGRIDLNKKKVTNREERIQRVQLAKAQALQMKYFLKKFSHAGTGLTKRLEERIYHNSFHAFSVKGLYPSPDNLISILIDNSPLNADRLLGNQKAQLEPIHSSQQESSPLPQVCKNFEEFMKSPLIKKFVVIGAPAPQGQQIKSLNIKHIHCEAIVNLLKGLNEYRSSQGETIDDVFKEKKISDLLQISYFTLALAMQEAIFYQNDDRLFNEKIELMHQVIQDILLILQPYDDSAVSEIVNRGVKEDILPTALHDKATIRVNVHSSGSHSLMSILTGVEAQKGDNHLNIVVLKDTYYESTDLVQECPKYRSYELNGHVFDKEGIDKAFTDVKRNAVSELEKDKKIDLFLCEFHHNIGLNKDVYRAENITQQIKKMSEKGLLADQCTIAIDTTLSGERDSDIQGLLNDETIQKLIQEGKLNIALMRSGQKFDLLGQDNYYCGFTTTISPQDKWQAFHATVNDPDNHINGLSRQAVGFLDKHVRQQILDYRECSIQATQEAYQKLDKKLLFDPASDNPLQIAKIEDDRIGFFDLKCDDALFSAIREKLGEYVSSHQASLSSRPSFGFSASNLIRISGTKLRLNIVTHPEVYANFFNKLQTIFDEESDLMRKAIQEEVEKLSLSEEEKQKEMKKMWKQKIKEYLNRVVDHIANRFV